MSLIRLLLDSSGAVPSSSSPPPESSPPPSPQIRVLDVGCGVGGTSRYLARELGCAVTGITISTRQVEIATRLATKEETPGAEGGGSGEKGCISLGAKGGQVRFLELDAEKMGEYFAGAAAAFDVVWISEALSHFPDKALFFANAAKVLRPGGKLVLADWFKAEGLGEKEFAADIKPIEGAWPAC